MAEGTRARRARDFMAAEFDGWAIARHCIAKEARERTGKLDLRGLAPVQLAKVCRCLSRRPSRMWVVDQFEFPEGILGPCRMGGIGAGSTRRGIKNGTVRRSCPSVAKSSSR